MALCNDPVLDKQLRLLRSHGITREANELTEPSHGPWYYQQVTLGFNYRMTDVQAALGLSQLSKLSRFVEKRIAVVQRYRQLLAGLPLAQPADAVDGVSAWHLYIIRVEACQRLQIFQQLRASGVGVNVHYIPIHTQPYYQALGFDWGQFPNAEKFYSQIISLPLYAALSEDQQSQVAQALRAALQQEPLR